MTRHKAGTPGDKLKPGDTVELTGGPPRSGKFRILDASPPPPRRGPKRGRYDALYRALCPDIDDLMKRGFSATAACVHLARRGRVPGTGTDYSRAKGLQRYWRDRWSKN